MIPISQDFLKHDMYHRFFFNNKSLKICLTNYPEGKDLSSSFNHFQAAQKIPEKISLHFVYTKIYFNIEKKCQSDVKTEIRPAWITSKTVVSPKSETKKNRVSRCIG